MVGCSVYGLWEETLLADVIKPLSTEGTTLWPYILLVFSQCLSCRKTDSCVCKPGVVRLCLQLRGHPYITPFRFLVHTSIKYMLSRTGFFVPL